MKVSDVFWRNLLVLKHSLKGASDGAVLGMNTSQSALVNDISELSIDSASWDLVACKDALSIKGFQSAQSVFNDRAFIHYKVGLSHTVKMHYQHYFPLAASRFIFRGESFLIAHAAQSLDGKVCTANGASQWIGNNANLVHAHRIRALVDGIIVGANTMRKEHPKLSVRHVSGDSPKRVVLCNSLEGINDEDLSNTVIICGEGSPASQQCVQRTKTYQCIQLKNNQQQKFDVAALRQALYEQDIQSVMLEGGPETVNHFIQQQNVDWLQLHIAPIMFGSGKSIYECQGVECVADALALANPTFVQMDDAMMLSGELSCVR